MNSPSINDEMKNKVKVLTASLEEAKLEIEALKNEISILRSLLTSNNIVSEEWSLSKHHSL